MKAKRKNMKACDNKLKKNIMKSKVEEEEEENRLSN
jgi:hypothetical protein